VVGPGGFGYIEFAAAVLMCASLVVDQGFSPFGAREIAKAPDQTGRMVIQIVTVRLLLAAVGYGGITLFALSIGRGPIMMRLLLIYGLSLWAAPFLLQWVFQGHDRMHLVAIAQVIRQTVFAAMVFAFVRGAENLLMVAWAEVAGVASAAAFCLLAYRRNFRNSPRSHLGSSPSLLREGVPIGLSQMFWVVKMFGGTLILGLIAPAQSVGLFAGAQRVLIAAHAFVWLYFFNLLPSMSRTWKADADQFGRLIDRSMRAVLWVGAGVALIWILLAGQSISIVYGSRFLAAGPVLALFALVCMMALISGHYRFGLIAAGQQDIEMLTSMLGAIVAVVAIPLGYFRWGLTGAALAIVFAEAVIWFTSWWCARRLLRLKGHARVLVRPLGALTLAAAGSSLLPTSPIVRTALATLIFGALAFGLDPEVRESARALLALRRRWSERRFAELAKVRSNF
jgi:PST family polysaccharide transporter